MIDVQRLVVDANIMVSALLGTSFPFFEKLVGQGVELIAAEPQLAETMKILSQRPFSSDDWLSGQLGRLLTVVTPVSSENYGEHEARARLRLHDRGQPDWPVLAVSIQADAAIWSHDKDFFGSGAPVWSTRMLLKQLAAGEAA